MSLRCRITGILPDWIIRAFGLQRCVTRVDKPVDKPAVGGSAQNPFVIPYGGFVTAKEVSKKGGVSSDADDVRRAHELYDNLHGDPETLITLPTYDRDGKRTDVRTSVARLSLLSNDHASRKRELEEALRVFTESGWFSERKLPESERGLILTGNWPNRGYQERAPELYDAEKCLDIVKPVRNGGLPTNTSSDPSSLPEWWPKPNLSVSALYPTPRILDRSVPSERIRAAYERLCVAIHRHLEGRNVTLRYHPAIIAALAPMNPDTRFANADLWYPFSEWRQNNGNPEYLFRDTVLHATVVPYEEGGGFRFSNHPFWFRSLDSRSEYVWIKDYGTVTNGVYDLGSSARSMHLYVCDALLEITRMVNAASHILKTENADASQRVLVNLHAAMTVKQNLQPIAHRHAGIPMGANVVEALESARREREARYRRQRSEALGIAGYQSSGDDGADIAALTIDSVGLAVGAGLSAAARSGTAGLVVGIVLFCVRFGIGLLRFFTEPDRPRDPIELPFRILRGVDRPWEGSNVRRSVMINVPYKAALIEPPVYRGL